MLGHTINCGTKRVLFALPIGKKVEKHTALPHIFPIDSLFAPYIYFQLSFFKELVQKELKFISTSITDI